MFSTKKLYMKSCNESKLLHELTDSEKIQLQSHLIKMYMEIERVCTRHNLRMMVTYGCAIGALRHKGFIPWDDDLDLHMPREDYDKFINEYAEELPAGYKIYSPNSKNGPIYRFAKVVDTNTRFLSPGARDEEKNGLFIDIFPLESATIRRLSIFFDQLISSALKYISSSVDIYEKKNKIFRDLMRSSIRGRINYDFRMAIGFVCSWKSSSFWYNLFDKFVSRHKFIGYYCAPSGGQGKRFFTPQAESMYFPLRKVPFENITVNLPNKVEDLLTIVYGDWHQIPPEEERWRHYVQELRFG